MRACFSLTARLADSRRVSVKLAISRKVAPQNILGFRHAQSRHHGKALRADAVHDAKVQTLRKRSLIGSHLILLNTEHLRGRHAMQIGARVERVDEALVAGELGQYAQLDL